MKHGESGNYRGYYKYRPIEADHRVKLLTECPVIDFTGKVCLDIGSNEGVLTLTVAEWCKPRQIVGIEPDKRLHDAAQAALYRALHKSSEKSSSKTAVSNPFKPRSILLGKPKNVVSKVTKSSTAGERYPKNVQFYCKGSGDMKSTGAYEIVLCLSVTKWIHLNEGDNGLLCFFRQLLRLSKQGGLVIVEYQPWKSYLNNNSASERIKEVFPTLQLRPKDFETILTTYLGFSIVARLGTHYTH